MNIPGALDAKKFSDPTFKADPDPKKSKEGGVVANMALQAYLLSEKFAEGAQIFLFACHSGTDPELVQNIADVFQVEVNSFTEEVFVCPATDKIKNTIDRNFTGIGGCASKAPGFAHLKPSSTRKPKAWSKFVKDMVDNRKRGTIPAEF